MGVERVGQKACREANSEGEPQSTLLLFYILLVFPSCLERIKTLSMPAVSSGRLRMLTPQSATDFDRFKIRLAKRSRSDLVRKAYVKEKRAAA